MLSLGLTLTAAVMLILRQNATRTRDSTEQLALRDAEEAAFGQIATLVAQGASPDAVFTSVAEQIGTLFHARTGAVSRFDAATNQGTVLGGRTPDGQELAGTVYALDEMTASAEVFRTGRAARSDVGYDSPAHPSSGLIAALGGKAAAAAPITVAGNLWGALGAIYGERLIPVGVELRLERFASLVGMAISNADAWDKLARQASTDPLTGIANRRTFQERLGAEVARAHRYGRDLSLVLIDLDHFKAVNDLLLGQGQRTQYHHPLHRRGASQALKRRDAAPDNRRTRRGPRASPDQYHLRAERFGQMAMAAFVGLLEHLLSCASSSSATHGRWRRLCPLLGETRCEARRTATILR